MSTTPALAAGQFRKLADVLDAAVDVRLSVYVGIRPDSCDIEQGGRVAVVDAIAALFGLTAEPSKSTGIWSHEAGDERGGVVLRVSTSITAPAQRCACGAVCTHTTLDGV